MATRKKPVRRPAKKAPAKKTNSKIGEAQKATNEVRKERDSLRAQSASEHRKLAAQKKTDPNPKLQPRTDTPMANSGRGVDQDKVAERDNIAGKSMSEAAAKIAGLAAPVMESMQAKARTEKKALSNPALYGVTNKNRAAKLTELMQAQQEQQNQAVKKSGDAVFMGQKKLKIRNTGQARYDDGNSNPDNTTTEAGPDDILTKQELLSWLADDAKVAEIKRVANQAGIAVESYDDIAKLWGSVVDMAASSYSFAGKKVTPWSIIQLRGKYMGADGKPTSKTTTSTSIDEMAPEQARLMFERTASDMLGRSATKAEIDDFIAKAQTIAKANPAVTKTTQQIGFDGNVTSQSSTTTGGAEAVNAKATVAAMDAAKQSEDYASYQAAGNYFPMLFEALNSPV
jgi:hypothetical protein